MQVSGRGIPGPKTQNRALITCKSLAWAGFISAIAVAVLKGLNDSWSSRDKGSFLQNAPRKIDLIDHYPHPGYVMNSKANGYCMMDPSWDFGLSPEDHRQSDLLFLAFKKPVEKCDQLFKKALQALSPEHFRQMDVLCPGKADKGCGVQIDLDRIALKIPEEKFNHFQQALNYLEATYLQSQNPFSQSPSEIVESLQKYHKLMLVTDKEVAGKFRTEKDGIGMIGDDDLEKDLPGLITALKRRGKGDTETIKALSSAYGKLLTHSLSQEKFISSLTPSEQSAFETVFTITLSPKKVQTALVEFTKELKEKVRLMLEGGLDPVSIAAWVHQKLIYIHPFLDGNGRVARAWMNLILQLGKLPPVFFSSEAEYSSAAREMTNSIDFEHLLRKRLAQVGVN